MIDYKRVYLRKGTMHFNHELNENYAPFYSQSVIDNLVSLLKAAQCPSCDGSGVEVVSGSGCEAGCCGNTLPNGECCGNAIPVQVEVQEQQQCRWCYERDEALKSL